MELKLVGLSLILISAILIFISLIRKNEPFFNLRDVIIKHMKIFENCPFQYVIFYGFPLLFAIGLAMIYEAGSTFYSNLSVILGILISMLFAILSILVGFDFSSVKDKEQQNKAKNVIQETVNSIVFDSVLCLFLMLYGLVLIVLDGVNFVNFPIDISIIKSILSGISYYIFTVILLTLLLIIKHMSKIIEFNIKAKRDGKE